MIEDVISAYVKRKRGHDSSKLNSHRRAPYTLHQNKHCFQKEKYLTGAL